MKYDKDSGGYILTPVEVDDLNELMKEAKRQYEAMKEDERLIPWWNPSTAWKS